MSGFVLRRVRFHTDAEPEIDYIGMETVDVIPLSNFRSGGKIVGIDWEREPGYVWVTFLGPAD